MHYYTLESYISFSIVRIHCQLLYKALAWLVWLDGDWCWIMNPFQITEENMVMGLNNITY